MDIKKYALISVIIVSFTTTLYSQFGSSEIFYLKGKVVTDENRPLIFTHVINIHRGYATVTDSVGNFKIPVVVNDSVRISSIGYHTKFVHIEKKMADSIYIVKLRKRAYDLPTVNIYELRWQVFKSEFMEEEVEEDDEAKRVSNWMANLVPAEELRMIYQSTMSPGFALNYKGKREKKRRKVAKIEKKYQLIAPKFNDEMIKGLTGLKGDAIYDFIKFCNFQEDFLISASEYEIMEKVLEYWKEYQKLGLHKK